MAQTDVMHCVICVGDRQVELREVPLEEPGPDEIRVRTVQSAVCGSDLHHYRMSAAERQAKGLNRFAIGHEGVGVVDEVGRGVTYPSVGDRVVIYHHMGCGHCQYCQRGEPGFCDEMFPRVRSQHGADAQYVVVPARYALPLPDDFDFTEGTLLSCNVGTAYGAVRKTGTSGDATLLVSGLGPVGLYSVMVGRAFGASVVGVDMQESRLELARKAGAEAVVNAADPDALDRIREFGGGSGVRGSGVHGAIETSGAPPARTTAIEALRAHGTYVEVGIGSDHTIVPSSGWDYWIWKEVTLRGSWIFKMHEWEDMLAFVRRHELPIKDLVTNHFPHGQAQEAFSLADSATAGKIILDWE